MSNRKAIGNCETEKEGIEVKTENKACKKFWEQRVGVYDGS